MIRQAVRKDCRRTWTTNSRPTLPWCWGPPRNMERGVLQMVVVDCCQRLWRERDSVESTNSTLLSYEDLIRSLLLYCNAHTTLARENLLCLMAFNEHSNETIFPSHELARLHSERAYVPLLTSFCEEITEKLLSYYAAPDTSSKETSHLGSLSKCLSQALCSESRPSHLS
jgi:hypothetical protein